jgi:hypothetical protein
MTGTQRNPIQRRIAALARPATLNFVTNPVDECLARNANTASNTNHWQFVAGHHDEGLSATYAQ